MARRRPSEIAAQLGMPVCQWNTVMLLGALAKPVFFGIAALIYLRERTAQRASGSAAVAGSGCCSVGPNLTDAREGQEGHARWIAGYILSHGSERITARDITRNYRLLKTPEDRPVLLKVMEQLEVMGWVRPENVPMGRQTTTWHVNPKVHSFEEEAQRERERRKQKKDLVMGAVAAVRKAAKGCP